MFLGKVLGLGVGYWLFNIPGAIVGGVSGHFYDLRRANNIRTNKTASRLSPKEAEFVRQAFFTATFSIMGHVSKSDGQVHASQIELAESVMERMGLNAELRTEAIRLFNEGKQAGFDLDRRTKRFRDDCANSTGLYRVFLELQIQIALANGSMAIEEEALLLHVSKILGFSAPVFRQMEMLVRLSMGLGDNHNARYARKRSSSDSRGSRSGGREDARSRTQQESGLSTRTLTSYQILGVDANADAAAVKKAYRKLINQHHPDKLFSKGLPEEMLRLATDKTQEIQKAYEQIKAAKGWK